MDLADVLNVGRAGLFVDFKRAVAVTDNGLSAANPRVVVAEDACVLFVARRVAGNFAQLKMIPRVGRLHQHDAILGV